MRCASGHSSSNWSNARALTSATTSGVSVYPSSGTSLSPTPGESSVITTTPRSTRCRAMLKLPTDGGAWMSKYPRDIPPPGTQQHTTGPTLSSAGTWTSAASVRTPAGPTSETSTRRVRDSCSLNRSGGFEALGQDDGLRLEVLVEALGPELAPETGLLEATERRREVHAHAVDAVGAGAHTSGDVDTALRIAGP